MACVDANYGTLNILLLTHSRMTVHVLMIHKLDFSALGAFMIINSASLRTKTCKPACVLNDLVIYVSQWREFGSNIYENVRENVMFMYLAAKCSNARCSCLRRCVIFDRCLPDSVFLIEFSRLW